MELFEPQENANFDNQVSLEADAKGMNAKVEMYLHQLRWLMAEMVDKGLLERRSSS